MSIHDALGISRVKVNPMEYLRREKLKSYFRGFYFTQQSGDPLRLRLKVLHPSFMNLSNKQNNVPIYFFKF